MEIVVFVGLLMAMLGGAGALVHGLEWIEARNAIKEEEKINGD